MELGLLPANVADRHGEGIPKLVGGKDPGILKTNLAKTILGSGFHLDRHVNGSSF